MKLTQDTGIVLSKKQLLNNNILLILFSQSLGLITLTAFGVRKITSRRISHLDTGNVIKFSYSEINDRKVLKETELMYGYSKIKAEESKMTLFYTLLGVLKQILPENEPEFKVYDTIISYLKRLNNQDLTVSELYKCIGKILYELGYESEELIDKDDIQQSLRKITGKRMDI